MHRGPGAEAPNRSIETKAPSKPVYLCHPNEEEASTTTRRRTAGDLVGTTGFVALTGANDQQIRDGAEVGQGLNRLVSGTVFT